MMEISEIATWIVGTVILLGACFTANKNYKGATAILFIVGILIVSITPYTSSLGNHMSISAQSIPENQLYLLETDLINSGSSDDAVLVLLLPIPIKAIQWDIESYKTNSKEDPVYYKIPKSEISLSLVKGDIIMKTENVLQKFRPLNN